MVRPGRATAPAPARAAEGRPWMRSGRPPEPGRRRPAIRVRRRPTGGRRPAPARTEAVPLLPSATSDEPLDPTRRRRAEIRDRDDARTARGRRNPRSARARCCRSSPSACARCSPCRASASASATRRAARSRSPVRTTRGGSFSYSAPVVAPTVVYPTGFAATRPTHLSEPGRHGGDDLSLQLSCPLPHDVHGTIEFKALLLSQADTWQNVSTIHPTSAFTGDRM